MARDLERRIARLEKNRPAGHWTTGLPHQLPEADGSVRPVWVTDPDVRRHTIPMHDPRFYHPDGSPLDAPR